MKAALYARYSSHEQDGGESIDFQLRKGREYIEKQGWILSDSNTFIDRARSGGTTEGRDGFNAMMGLAKSENPPFDVVVVWHTSRFGRDSDQAMFNKVYLKRYGIDVKFVSQNIPEGHIGKLIERIYEWKDEADAILIGQNAFEGQKEVTQKGFNGGGRPPYGYKRVMVDDPDGKLDKDGQTVTYSSFAVDEDKADLVRRIFQEYASGMSYKKIAHQLNDEGIPSARGGTWAQSGIREMLYNETYLGHRIWNRNRRNKKVRRGVKTPKPREEWIIKENAHEAIICPELWQAVEDRRGQIKAFIEAGRGNGPAYRSNYLLTGLLKCAECGGNMHGMRKSIKGKEWMYYRCSTHNNRGKSVCSNSRSVRMDIVESRVLRVLTEKLLDPKAVERLVADVRAQVEAEPQSSPQEAKRLKAGISKADKELTNLTTAIKAGGPIEQLVGELKAVQERKTYFEAQLNELAGAKQEDMPHVTIEEIIEAITDLKATLEFVTPEERKDVLLENINSVEVPQKGDALLEPNPEGILSHLLPFCLVTPRGVEPPLPD